MWGSWPYYLAYMLMLMVMDMVIMRVGLVGHLAY